MTLPNVPRFGARTVSRSIVVDDLRDAIRRRSLSVHGRRLVADAIYELALDIIGDAESLSPRDREWLRQALTGPVTEATEEALNVLTQEMTAALRAAPPRARSSLAVAQPVHRTDFE